MSQTSDTSLPGAHRTAKTVLLTDLCKTHPTESQRYAHAATVFSLKFSEMKNYLLCLHSATKWWAAYRVHL